MGRDNGNRRRNHKESVKLVDHRWMGNNSIRVNKFQF